MWSYLIIVLSPSLQFLTGIREVHEPMCVQTFRPKTAVKTFDKRIICGFTKKREINNDIVLVSLLMEIFADKFRVIINPYAFRMAMFAKHASHNIYFHVCFWAKQTLEARHRAMLLFMIKTRVIIVLVCS